ncbi:TonB-dependent receptor [Mucilaginibacter calamicampi]|uniref:TonB-dependent receptor n=2 Tax=Mucilaginibacter calamicampi TaxID=1302352 RepID=A0ABW2YSP5_9SPHI
MFNTLFRVCFVLLTICSAMVKAQTGSISGKVVVKDQPLAAASVKITGTSIGIKTDENGYFRLNNISPGQHELQVSAIGYASQKQWVKVMAESSSELTIALTPVETNLNEVVITGVTRATQIRNNPVPIAVMNSRAINSQANTNIVDAITRSIPGVSAVTTGPNISKPFIRGLGYNRVLTLYDGVRQEGQQWGDEHGIEIDQFGISRVEVIKGPASLTYGSDALAGVINMIPDVVYKDDNKLHGDISTEAHTNNGSLGASLGLNYKNGDWKYSARSSVKRAHDYRNSVDGFVYNTGFNELNLSAMAKVDKQWGAFKIAANLYNNQQEIPDGSRDQFSRRFTKQVDEAGTDDITNRPIVSDAELRSYKLSPLYQHIQHYRVYTHGVLNVGQGNIDALFAVQQSVRREYNHPTAPEQPGLYVVLNTLNYDIKYNLPELQGWEATIGLNGMFQGNRSKNGTAFPIPDYNLFDAGTYVLVKKKIGDFNVLGGLRYDNRNINWNDFYVGTNAATGFERKGTAADIAAGAPLQFPAFSKVYHGISGSAGLTYNITERVLLKANIARGYRAPNITEIGSNGLDPGAHIVYLGNRTFAPEFSLQQDLGFAAYLKNVDISAEVFNNNITNYIFQSKLTDAAGNPVIIVPGNTTYQYQQAAARLCGAELTVNLHPQQQKWLNFNNSVAYIRGVKNGANGTPAEYLPLIPPLHARSEIKAMINNFYIKAAADMYATQNRFYATDDTETATPGYSLFSLGTGITVKNKADKTVFELSVMADNIFDKAYQSHLNRLKYFEYYQTSPNGRYGIYNMGRNVSFRLTVPF